MIIWLHHTADRFYRSRTFVHSHFQRYDSKSSFAPLPPSPPYVVWSGILDGEREVAINLPLISIFPFRCAVPAILLRTSNQLESNFSFIIVRLLYFYFWRYTHTRTLVRPSTSDFSAQLLQRLSFSSFICSIKTFRETTTKTNIFHLVWLRFMPSKGRRSCRNENIAHAARRTIATIY